MKRTEFGYYRAPDCVCTECVNNCQHLSGMLVPEDLPRMSEACGYSSVVDFAAHHLSASPGAVVAQDGVAFRIQTLVPRRDESGRCTFLDQENRCTIHAASPFGCAFFGHLSPNEDNRRSSTGLHAIMEQWNKGGLYAAVWTWLAQRGMMVRDPIEARKDLAAKNGGGS